MRYLRFTLLPVLLVACTDTQAPIDQQPLFDFANAPPQSGIVERGDGVWAVSWSDSKTGWRVVFGADMLEFCSGIVDFDEVHWADKVLPQETERIVDLSKKGEARTSVWPFMAFDCGLFTTVDPLASGLSVLISTDNDFYGSNNPNTNSWGFRAHGTLAWTADGSPAHFSFHRQLVWHKGNPAQIKTQKLVLK